MIVQQTPIYTIIVLYNLCMKKLQLLIFHNIFKILEDTLSFVLRLKTSLPLRLQTDIYRCGDQTCFYRKLQQGCLTAVYLKKLVVGLCLYDLNQFMYKVQNFSGERLTRLYIALVLRWTSG